MILHLVDDVHVINSAYTLFEKYYPKKNTFIVQIGRNQHTLKVVQSREGIYATPFTTPKGIRFVHRIAQQREIKFVFVHYLTPSKAAIAMQLHRSLGAKLGWFFFGADLYEYLHKKKKYQLNDQALSTAKIDPLKIGRDIHFFLLYGRMPIRAYTDFIAAFDFFYTWNEYDYQLLKKHFESHAQFKSFAYFGLLAREGSINTTHEPLKILVNHSASQNGNHLTVLDKLDTITQNQEIIVPISYGSHEIQKQIRNYSLGSNKNRIELIQGFLPLEEYYALISTVFIAIFGHRRQEAAANIFYLLSVGVKVFLRNDNNLIHWLRDRGFKVFSFEDDLSSEKDLEPLSKSDALHNHAVYHEVFSLQREQQSMMNLLT